ncbi:MAG: hypothetical protein KDB24_17420 [Microthrixaceae bacterium]|nr:hypothetical protein [Microthrixaceae bacterium]
MRRIGSKSSWRVDQLQLILLGIVLSELGYDIDVHDAPTLGVSKQTVVGRWRSASVGLRTITVDPPVESNEWVDDVPVVGVRVTSQAETG